MPLEEDEIEMLARRRMIKNVLEETLDILREADPKRAEELDRILEEYVDEAREACSDQGDAEAIIRCIMDRKQEHEPRIRDEMQKLR